MKPNLIIVKSQLNDESSDKFLNVLESYHKNYYENEIDITTIDVQSQEQLNEYLDQNSGSVLLLQPTDLKLFGKNSGRDIEKSQAVDSLMILIEYAKKILILGDSKISKDLDNKIRFDNKIVATCAYEDSFLLDQDLLNKFDVIINLTNYKDVVCLFFSGTVIDFTGNFQCSYKTKYDKEKNVEIKTTPLPSVISCETIHQNTADAILDDLIKSK